MAPSTRKVVATSSGASSFSAFVVVLLSVIVGLQIQNFLAKEGVSLTELAIRSLRAPSAAPASSPSSNATGTSTPKAKGVEDPIAAEAAVAPPIPRHFYHSDFESYFGLKYLPKVEVDPIIAKFVNAHDIRTDDLYTQDPLSSDRWAQNLGWFFENPIEDDRRFYVRFISKDKGYGMFSAIDIGPGVIVGVYTGVLTNNSISDYMWSYPSQIKDENGQVLNLGIDSRFKGNWERFVNHDDNPNTEVIYMPYNNLWHVVYITTAFIRRGEEVTVSYGSAYWETRQHIPKVEGVPEPTAA
ncbi:hypothetical protein HDU96_000218 [Phlyctochytrium bullatum]|nr:hypothetical protein HDU96_000218 [Phlyctochytrium bullatum]